MKYLLDTIVISETTKKKPEPKVLNFLAEVAPEQLYISALTLGELHKGIEKLDFNNSKKQTLTLWLENDFLNFFKGRIINIDEHIVAKWGYLLGQLKHPAHAIDSLIAATALAYNLKLVSRDIADFSLFPMAVFNPWEN